MWNKINETGNVYGRLTVLNNAGSDKWGQSQWNCVCQCGNLTCQPGSVLRKGLVISCGCYNNEQVKTRSISHGMTGTKIYSVWASIIARCENPKHSSYDRYGAIGVTVCKEWRESFEKFYEDMGDIPDGCEINRKRSVKQYNKENCEWVNLSIQAYDKGIGKNNVSGRIGVNYSNYDEKWVAQINKEGKVYKKKFNSFEEACSYREKLELEHFGFTKDKNKEIEC